MGMRLQLRYIDEAVARAQFFEPEFIDDNPMADEDGELYDGVLDLDKMWHIIHYLLTGSADPVDSPLSLMLGYGEVIGGDFGYGPPLLISADQMAEFQRQFRSLSDDDLRRRYDPAVMQAVQIYIADALAGEGEEGWPDVNSYLIELRKFAAHCANNNLAAISLIS